jgi:hypothetical protein
MMYLRSSSWLILRALNERATTCYSFKLGVGRESSLQNQNVGNMNKIKRDE